MVPSGTHGNHSAERQGGVSEDRYLSALIELRKRWKLRRSATGITVDISFASGVWVSRACDLGKGLDWMNRACDLGKGTGLVLAITYIIQLFLKLI